MLEIIIVWQLCKKTGQIALDKGRPAIGFQILTAILWIVGEFIGAVVGMIVQGHERVSAQVYIFAILGAAIGAGIAFAVVMSVPEARRKRKRRRRRRCRSCGEPVRQPGPCVMCGEHP